MSERHYYCVETTTTTTTVDPPLLFSSSDPFDDRVTPGPRVNDVLGNREPRKQTTNNTRQHVRVRLRLPPCSFCRAWLPFPPTLAYHTLLCCRVNSIPCFLPCHGSHRLGGKFPGKSSFLRRVFPSALFRALENPLVVSLLPTLVHGRK